MNETCFWCGGILGRFYNVYLVDGVSQPFHCGLYKDCLNAYLKHYNSQHQSQLQLIGGTDGRQSEHHDGVKGLRGGHRFRSRLSFPPW